MPRWRQVEAYHHSTRQWALSPGEVHVRVDRHVAAHVAVVQGQSAALLDVVHRVPHQLEAPVVVVAARQSVLVVDRRQPPRVAAAEHVVHFDQHVGILGVDSLGQIEIRADVVLLAIRHGMAVVRDCRSRRCTSCRRTSRRRRRRRSWPAAAPRRRPSIASSRGRPCDDAWAAV